MSFLRVNGLEVSVAKFSEKVVEIGSRARAVDGTYLLDRRATKRRWEGETTWLTQATADLVKAVLRGEGHIWPLDSNVYSQKGLAAESGGVDPTFRGAAADGDPVADEYKFTAAAAFEQATTNYLDADSRDAENAPTGYSAVYTSGAPTLSADTDNYWQGTKSLKVVTNAAGGDIEGARATSTHGTGSSGIEWWGSVYLKGDSGGEAVTVYLRDVTNGTDGTKVNVVLSATEWTRVRCTITTALGANTIGLYVMETNADSNITFYADGWQYERDVTEASSWVDGSRASDVDVQFDPGFLSTYRDITVNVWARLGTANPGGSVSNTRPIMAIGETSGAANRFYLYRGQSNNELIFYTTDEDGNADSFTASSPWDDDWHMVTAVLRIDPASGVDAKELYIDGVSVGSSNPAALPQFDSSALTNMTVGTASGFGPLRGLMDDLAILPIAVDANTVSNWYAAGRAMLATGARVYVDGDALSDQDLTVEAVGAVVGSKFAAGDVDGTWRNNLEAIRFVLEEA